MNNPTIELNRNQLIADLSQFPPEALKKLIDELFKKKLYAPPSLERRRCPYHHVQLSLADLKGFACETMGQCRAS
jgi:hypothetical protein